MLTTPLSVIAGIVLGEYSVQSGWFNSETMLYMAFVTVANYSQASYELGYAPEIHAGDHPHSHSSVQPLGLSRRVVLSACFIIFNKTIAGKSYIYPLIPFSWSEVKKRFLRTRLPHQEEKQLRRLTKPAASAIIAPMIRQTYSYFDLRQIAASGQCFRMRETGPGQFTIISRGKILTVSQEETSFSFSCGEEDFPFWEQYFDLTTDYGRIQAAVSPKDPYLQAAAQAGKGIRILRQDPWEMIITFVISQQKTIPMIREAVERLSASYGSPIREETAPPSPFPPLNS